MSRNLALTGLPRSGTTLACRLVGECADTVALFEPMRIEEFPRGNADAATAHVIGYFQAARRQLLEHRTAANKVVHGAVPDNPFSRPSEDGKRVLQASEGELHVQAGLAPGFTLAIKHNAAFTALLPQLCEQLEIVAIIRHPLAVLASWHSLDLPVSAGRLPAGEWLDSALAAALEAEPDLVSRQLRILDWFFDRYARIDASRVLRYEAIVATGGSALAHLCGLAQPAAPRVLGNLNTRSQCPPQLLPMLAERLEKHQGSWTHWYAADSIAPLLRQMQAA